MPCSATNGTNTATGHKETRSPSPKLTITRSYSCWSRSVSSVCCISQNTDDTDATMLDLEEDVLADGRVVVGTRTLAVP